MNLEPSVLGSIRFRHVSMNLLNLCLDLWWVELSSMVNQWGKAQLLYSSRVHAGSKGHQLKKSGSSGALSSYSFWVLMQWIVYFFLDKCTSIICSLGTRDNLYINGNGTHDQFVRCILQQSMKHTGVGVVKSTPPTGCIIWNFWVLSLQWHKDMEHFQL